MYPKIGFLDSYSLMIFIGVIFVIVFIEIYGKKKQLDRLLVSYIEINGVIAVILGLVGANLFQNLYNFIENPSSFSWSWSMTFYGGLIFGVISFLCGYFLVIRNKFGPCLKEHILAFAPSCIAIGQGFGRIGCFLAGCCYGRETTSWIGVKFPGMESKVIPTNLMEAIFMIILAIVLLFIALKKGKYSLPMYLFSYSIWRFVIEFYRGDHRGELIKGLSPSQFWSIILFIIGIGYVIYLYIDSNKIALFRNNK